MKAVDVVTAEGKLVYCNSEVNSDLFLAARGAGPGEQAVMIPFTNIYIYYFLSCKASPNCHQILPAASSSTPRYSHSTLHVSRKVNREGV